MKNLIKKSLLAIMLLTLLGSNAMSNETNLNDNLIIVNGKLIDLTLKYTDGDLKVNVKDSFGLILYNDTYTGTEFNKKFDLTSLPNGNYQFEIEGQTRIITIPFVVSSNNVDFHKEDESIFYKPIVRIENDNIYISKMAFNNESLKVALYDKDSNLLYTEELIGKINLERNLNISKLMKGDYRLIMISENRRFEQIMKKRK